MQVTPYKESSDSKKAQVAQMFNNISHRYDFLNHFLSLGIDKLWRRKAISILKKENPKVVLDIATGTGDFALAALRMQPDKIIGIDISEGMLEKGRQKIKKAGYEQIISLNLGDSENLQFADETFDAVTVAFGVRNFEDLNKGIAEIHRVLKKDGTAVILEFSIPTNFFFKSLYNFYFKLVLPFVGKLVSKDKSAYSYLPESVEKFPYGNAFLDVLKKSGFNSTQWIKLTMGISAIYIAKK